MIYGPLTWKDRLIRAAMGACLGAAAAVIVMLQLDTWKWGLDRRPSYLLPAALAGAIVGGLLGFRRK
jgi:hypothetical protein